MKPILDCDAVTVHIVLFDYMLAATANAANFLSSHNHFNGSQQLVVYVCSVPPQWLSFGDDVAVAWTHLW